MINWDEVAAKLGYTSEVSLWVDLYTTRGLSISQIARKLDVSRNTIRGSLEKAGIQIRKQGGPNNQRLVVTDELVDEIRKDGVAVVAARLGLDYSTLYKRLRNVRKLKVSDLRVVGSPPSAESPESASSPSSSPTEESHQTLPSSGLPPATGLPE